MALKLEELKQLVSDGGRSEAPHQDQDKLGWFWAVNDGSYCSELTNKNLAAELKDYQQIRTASIQKVMMLSVQTVITSTCGTSLIQSWLILDLF